VNPQRGRELDYRSDFAASAPSGNRIIGLNTGALTARELTGILRELYGKAA
jgi:hypothetical protein